MANQQNPFDFSDLASSDEQIKADTKKASKTVDFDCIECGGSGLWNAGKRNHHGNAKCWTCGGTGTVKTDPYKLRQGRADRAQKKADKYQDFLDANEEVVAAISAASEWSEFARSLMQQLISDRKLWSEKQLASARSMAAKIAARQEQRQAERAKEAQSRQVEVDLSAIRAMFDRAIESGLKKPKYRAEGLVISLAPANGRNAGALYVVDVKADYQGKIFGTVFEPLRSALPDTAARLQEIAKDPAGKAVAYGRAEGICSCCGRTLTDPESIAAGIGPICAQKWGF